MPYYEYQGKTYEISTEDPAEAKAKIQAYLADTKIDTDTGQEFGAGELAQMALPAVSNYGPTGIAPMAKELGQAVAPYAKSAASAATAGYRARPLLTAAIDTLGLGTIATPVASAYNSAMGMYDQFGRAKGAAQDVGKVLSQSSLIQSPVTGMPYPESVPAFREMQRAAPEFAQRLSEAYQRGGGNNAVKALLATPEAAQYMRNPAFAAAAEQYMGKVPGAGAQAMKIVNPLLRGAAKALGPVGLGMNAYDASQFAQEAELGNRLASGQGRNAQRAFRNIAQNMQYGGLTAEEQAILEQDRIDQAIRRKAAERVLGPVAPTGQ
jgi:hypothetical protein